MLSRMWPLNWLRRPWKPLSFANSGFTRLPVTQRIEEENLPDYNAARYYPTRIGEILQDRYQVVGKLGYGATSTAWLARDMHHRRYVTLKIYIKSASIGQSMEDELRIYKRISNTATAQSGRSAVRFLLDTFKISGPEDQHQCLVHEPLFESVWTFLHRNPIQRLPKVMLAFILQRTFLALDCLHTECQADNIMFEFSEQSVLVDFEQGELQAPCPRKELEGRYIYMSRELKMPKNLGAPVLCDFGSAVDGGVDHLEDVQPNIYRAPEVILEVPWTYSVDIWNVGCMIWDIFEGGSLFTGQDPELNVYRSRAHLAEMISLLGPPPPDFIARGQLSHKFFTEGRFSALETKLNPVSLEQRETTLSGEDKADFLRFMSRMLQWEPEKRSSAKSLAQDDWIVRQLK
ncbi:Serine/threonine-protein kinase SRPK [Beauveria bassiana]|nr:Serine/threonine-protein kinase SRPK [Beauveria bassiana]